MRKIKNFEKLQKEYLEKHSGAKRREKRMKYLGNYIEKIKEINKEERLLTSLICILEQSENPDELISSAENYFYLKGNN